jgi:tripartite-type tricarboxylate transporter receptor subunit TctC
MPEIRAYLFERGLDPAPTTPEAFAAYIKAEMLKWTRVVRAAGAAAG